MSMLFPPGLILIASGLALLLPLRSARLREAFTLLAPLAALAYAWNIPEGAALALPFMGYTVKPVFAHAYTLIFATIFCLAAFAGALFWLRQAKPREMAAAFVYAGGAVGVTFAGDFLTLFVFWEIMAVASLVILWCGGTPGAKRAGMRYALMHFLGGVVLLAGIAGYAATTASVELAPLALREGDIAPALIFIGILVNLAAPPFSAWLPDAYPEASPGGAVFLSAFTTKTAVFVLLTLFAGTEALVWIGLFMVFYGIVYAMLENDMRRILAYSVVNQVGFMAVGIGIGTETALNGAAAHAFCHIIYKALLFMSAGSVLYMTGKRKCSDLGGLYHSMRLTAACGIVGALAISAFPFTSGFVSKSLISDAAGAEQLTFVWFALAAASAGVFLHAGIKFPWFVFFQKDSGMRPKDPPANMRHAMLLLVGLCILPGVWPGLLYAMLPGAPAYAPNSYAHIVTQLQLLLFSGLAFFLMLPWLQRSLTISLDFDWLWRIPGVRLLRKLDALTKEIYANVLYLGQVALRAGFRTIFRHAHPGAWLAQSISNSAAMLAVGIVLAAYLLIYYNF